MRANNRQRCVLEAERRPSCCLCSACALDRKLRERARPGRRCRPHGVAFVAKDARFRVCGDRLCPDASGHRFRRRSDEGAAARRRIFRHDLLLLGPGARRRPVCGDGRAFAHLAAWGKSDPIGAISILSARCSRRLLPVHPIRRYVDGAKSRACGGEAGKQRGDGS